MTKEEHPFPSENKNENKAKEEDDEKDDGQRFPPGFGCKEKKTRKRTSRQSGMDQKVLLVEKDEIVISGISGRFPESDDLHEFWNNLVNGVDMVTEDDRRWTPGFKGLPTRSGKLKTLDKFDAQFFGVHPKQAEFMDPQLRMLLEATQEAIIDAGVNPVEIRGSRTGVFVGASTSEFEKLWLKNSEIRHGYALTGCNRGMFSNRISFSFDFQGPSFTVDTACSSSFIALEQAVASIRHGYCDAAIVGGTHLCLEPDVSLQFHRLSMLSPDGKCKSFDASGNGYVRSEAVVAIFIQKKDVALRSYASILAARTNSDGHKDKGVTFPSGQRQAQLLEETYREAGIDPKDVVYVEAHGTGTQAGDPQELNAISDVFCKNREKDRPLLIGSVKSNTGHAEPASGLMSMAKVLLAMQQGILPANLHYKTPNPNIPALCDGRLKVVAQNMPWDGGIVGMNSFGFGGANVHVILKSNPKKSIKNALDQNLHIPFLIPFSGRSKDAVEFALQKVADEITCSSNLLPQQLERLALCHQIARSKIPGHTFRGHTVISPGQKQIDMDVLQNNGPTPPVWFIFNGMGSQWPLMGRDLLKLNIFENSIKESAAILKPHGIDLLSVLLHDDETALTENVIKSFVAITSIQVALVDLLRSLGVTPTGGIVGHSVGELGASYADGCFTVKQTVLAALARGRAITESAGNIGAIEGAMAAIGLSWEEAKQRCPPGIYPACHNAKDSVTISGPKKDIEHFVQNLKNEGIFAKEVNSSKMAFHSKYIEPARSKLQNLMEDIIPTPHPRSARWISSSIPENEWDSPLAQSSSADYHVNNLLSPVLFQESLQKIPEGCVVIEIGPHSLLQAILKRSLPSCTNIGLVNKTHPDNSIFLLHALGKLYNSGLNLNFPALYPPVEFPVAIDTPSISPLVKWDHSFNWDVPRFPENDTPFSSDSGSSGEIVMEISLNEESQKFYKDHKIDGRIIFPATGYFLLIWRAFASLQKKHFEQVPIVLENVSILRATVLTVDGAPVKFHISILKGTGEFEIRESGAVIVTGIARSPNGNEFLPLETPQAFNSNQNIEIMDRILMSNADAYKELKLRGYDYSGVFKGIQNSDSEGDWAKVKWEKNWVSFLDTVLQVPALHMNTRALYLPTYLDKAIFDPLIFLQSIQQQIEDKKEKEFLLLDDDEDEEQGEKNTVENLVPVFNYPDLTVVTCEGVQFQRFRATTAPRRNQITSANSSLLRLEKFEFTPYFDLDDSNYKLIQESPENCLSVCLDIVLENVTENTLKVLEILGNEKGKEKVLSTLAQTHILNQPTKNCDGKAIFLAQGQGQGQVTEVTGALQNSGIEVTLATTENEAELIRKISSSVDLIITDQIRLLMNESERPLSLRDQGFLLYHKQNKISSKEESEPEFKLDFETLEDSSQLFLIAHKISASRHFYLFKKSSQNFHSNHPIQNLVHTIEINLSPNLLPYSLSHFNYSWVQELKMAMQKGVESKNEPYFRIYLISRENKTDGGLNIPSGVLGLVNSLRKEPGGDKIRCFFIRGSPKIANDLNFHKPSKSLSFILQRDLVMNLLQENEWGSMRFYSLPEQNKMTRSVEHAYLNAMTRGDLSSLKWFESDLKYHEPKSELCRVYYAPLNFRDVMLCSGKLALDSLPNNLGTKECVLGLEWSGKTQDGVRIMGVVRSCGLATSIVPDKEFLWTVPKLWTLEEAATVPVAYATAYYALVVRGKIQNGESILIHAGAGGVGMAAIRVALSLSCKVYTTVGSQEKRDILMKTFPQLNESSFENSRDSNFLEHILRETKGRGVDLVLNSLAGEKLQASIKCLAMKGRFLEIGKVDLFKNTSLGMSIFLKNVSVHGILVDGIVDGDPEKVRVRNLVQEGINSGVVKPLTFTTFTDSLEDVEKAFRFMASGKHVGKILIKIRNENDPQNELQVNSTDSSKLIEALPRTHFDPKKCYIIIGGLGGFGLELCGWLIERGASKLALVSRSGVKNGYQGSCLRRWRKEGATILTPTTDITTLEGVTTLLKETTSTFGEGSPIGGIFNLAMVLADGLLEKQTPETFQTVSRPKINSTIFLDQVSRTLAPSLEYFVVFSSVVSGRGAPGLSNYAWANSGMERICEQRQKDGLPGLAIMWGAIGDVGVLQEEKRMGNHVEVGGMMPQRISSCLNTMDILLHQSKYKRQPVLSSMILSDRTKKDIHSQNGLSSGKSLMDKVGNILGMKSEGMKNLDPNLKLYELGMDSLMGVEIKQLLELTTGCTLNESDMMELTFEKIKSLSSQNPTSSLTVDEKDKKEEDSSSSATKNHEDLSAVTEITPKAFNLETPDDFTEPPKEAPSSSPQRKRRIEKGQKHAEEKSLISPNCSPFADIEKIHHSKDILSSFDLKSGTPIISLYAYCTTVLILLISGILLLCSLIIRLGVQLYLKMFHDPSDLKLLSRPYDQVCAANKRTSNMAFTLKLSGVPSKSKIIRMVNERVLNWKTNISFEAESASESVPEYEPYESLRWRIKEGYFFHYWERDSYFNVLDHVVFEKCASGDELQNAALRASEFYHNHKWTNLKGRGRPKPQWEIKIISPHYPVNYPPDEKEFVLIVATHHGYGDAFSALHMLQYAMSDVKPPIHQPQKLDGAASTSLSPPEKILEKRVINFQASRLRKVFTFLKDTISSGNQVVIQISRIRQTTKDHTLFCKVPDSKRHCGVAKYSLSRMKSVVTREGDPVSVISVVLTCTSKVYKRLYAEHALRKENKNTNSKTHKPPNYIMAFLPYAIQPYKKLGLVNNFTNSYTTVPLGQAMTSSALEEKEEDEVTTVVQRSVEESRDQKNLEASWIITRIVSLLANPLDKLAFRILPSPSMMYTNVPATIPRHITFFGGHKVKDFFGFTMLLLRSNATLASAIDSSTDTVSLSMVVDDSALELCPEFLERFFAFFQEELDLLVNQNCTQEME